MTTFGKSIRIYLKDGTPTGVRFGEIFNQTIMAIACPKARFAELKDDEAAKRPGIYFLIGDDAETRGTRVNIGEAENVYDRLKGKIPKENYDFCKEVIFFTSKDENLTKAHVKYLESRSIETANQTRRYVVDNPNDSQAPSLPISDRDAMEEFFLYLKLLLGVFGHKFLEELNPTLTPNASNQELQTPERSLVQGNIQLKLSISGLSANAIQSDEGILVLPGSEATQDTTASLQNGYRELRDDLISKGVLIRDGHKFIFQREFLFNSSSAAAAIIVGHSISGPQTWRDNTGRTLKEIQEQSLS